MAAEKAMMEDMNHDDHDMHTSDMHHDDHDMHHDED